MELALVVFRDSDGGDLSGDGEGKGLWEGKYAIDGVLTSEVLRRREFMFETGSVPTMRGLMD